MRPSPAGPVGCCELVREEVRGLVRVSKIENPDVALLSPEQSFFRARKLQAQGFERTLGSALPARRMPPVQTW